MDVADTSWLFALFAGDDAHHAKAAKAARSERSFVIPSEILAETLRLVRWRLGGAAYQQVLAALTAIPHARIAPSPAAAVAAAVGSCVRSGSLSYEDWIVVHTCRITGARPRTFDADILREVP